MTWEEIEAKEKKIKAKQVIKLNHCIYLNSPDQEIERDRWGEKQYCDCYQKNLFFIHNFVFYYLECCKGWFGYLYQREGLTYILNKALKNKGILTDRNEIYGFMDVHRYTHKRGTEYFGETCTFKPDFTGTLIPIVDIVNNPREYCDSFGDSIPRYFYDHNDGNFAKSNRKLRSKIIGLYDYNLENLNRLIEPGFIRKEKRQQIEILVKHLRKTIRNVKS